MDGDKSRESIVFHRLLVITLQICTVLLSVEKTEAEDYMFRKVLVNCNQTLLF